MLGSDRIKITASQSRECDVTAARQLHLFRGRKQCGIAPPVASEYQLHCAVADTVRRWIMPGWIYTHIASGEKRDAVTAAWLKRLHQAFPT